MWAARPDRRSTTNRSNGALRGLSEVPNLDGYDSETVSRVGRPSKLSNLGTEDFAKLEAVIRAGASVEVAGETIGVPRGTIYDWLKKGESEEVGPHRRLLRPRRASSRRERGRARRRESRRSRARGRGRRPRGYSSASSRSDAASRARNPSTPNPPATEKAFAEVIELASAGRADLEHFEWFCRPARARARRNMPLEAFQKRILIDHFGGARRDAGAVAEEERQDHTARGAGAVSPADRRRCRVCDRGREPRPGDDLARRRDRVHPSLPRALLARQGATRLSADSLARGHLADSRARRRCRHGRRRATDARAR